MDLISVIVPVYQVRDYLCQCLDSILAQTYNNLEIILVDDGSTDGSEEICDMYENKDSRIRVIHKKNGGLVSARKAGIKEAKGDYIGYVDSDDYIEDTMYEKLHQVMRDNDADIVVCNHLEIKGNCSEIKQIRNYIPSGVYRGNSIVDVVYKDMLYAEEIGFWGLSPACWEKLYKKDLIYNLQMSVDDRIWDGEDHAFVYPAILDSNCVVLIEDDLYVHRIREDSVATGYDERAFERFSYLFNGLKKKLRKSKYWDEIKTQFSHEMRWFLYKHIYTELGIPCVDDSLYTRAYLFPFSEIEKNSNIIIYGGGMVGRLYYRQITHSGYCNLMAWVDKNYMKYKYARFLTSPQDIFSGGKTNFDYVVIGVEDSRVADSIRTDLRRFGVIEEKIIWKNPKMDIQKEIRE